MATMSVVDGKYVLSQVITGAGDVSHVLATENKFVDKNIEIATTVAAGALGAGTSSMEASSNTGMLGTASSTQPATGYYIKLEGDANVAVATSGWLDEGDDVDVSVADVYYPLAVATFTESGASVVSTAEGYVAAGETVGTIANGSQTITGGALSAGAGSAALASDGYYDGSSYDTSDKVALTTTEASGYYKVTASGSGTVNRAAVTSQVTSAGYFAADSSPVTEIAAGSESSNTAEEAYYILKSTLSDDSITPSTSSQTVTIGAGYYPSARTVTVAAMAPGAAASSTANTGLSTYFDAGTSSDNDVSITPQYSITTAGYLAATSNPVDGTPAYYKIKEQSVTETTTTVSGTTATRGTRTESVGWKDTAETLDVATFANSATSGETYVDISGTTAAPVLVSGDYLYINGGWTDNVKISLAKLVPDGSDVKGHSEYILSGHSAYDDDGTLVAGSIPTYAGEYDVE